MSSDKQSQLSDARSRKASYERQRADHRQAISNNKAKIERLQEAKREIKTIKDTLEEASKDLKTVAADENTYYEWSGQNQLDVAKIFSEDVPTEYKYYINAVDIVLDSIVSAETALENDNLRRYGIIGQLGSWINSLASTIEKLCN